MITTGNHTRIFHRNLVLHVNGCITIRSFIFLLSTRQIVINVQGIPLICTDQSGVSLIPPECLQITTINHEFQGNQYLTYVCIQDDLMINLTDPNK